MAMNPAATMTIRMLYSTEQIIQKLREAEVELAKGRSVGEVAKQLGITDHAHPGGV